LQSNNQLKSQLGSHFLRESPQLTNNDIVIVVRHQSILQITIKVGSSILAVAMDKHFGFLGFVEVAAVNCCRLLVNQRLTIAGIHFRVKLISDGRIGELQAAANGN